MASLNRWGVCCWLLLSPIASLWAQDSTQNALLTELRQARADTGRVSVYLKLARSFSYQPSDSSLLFATKGYALAGRTGQDQQQASLRMWMGFHYKKTKFRNDSLSIRYLDEALALARDSLVRAEILYLLGTYHYDAGQLRQAATRFTEALRFVGPGPEKPTRQFVPVLTQLLGMIYLRLGQYDFARQYLRRGLQAVNRRDRPSTMAGLLMTNAEVLEAQHQQTAALTAYQQALVYARKANTPHLIATALNGIGRYWLSQQNSTKAITYFQMALPLAWRGLDRGEEPIIDTYINMAMSYIQANRPDSALANAERAYNQAHQFHRVLFEEKTLTTLIEARMLNNDYRGAMAALRQVQQLRNRLFSADQVRAVAEVERRYELEKKENTLRQTETQLKQQQQLRWLITGVAVLLLIVLLVGILLYRRLLLTKRVLADQIDLVEQQAGELQAVNQTKDKLFAVLSHDLRAPVVSLKNTLSLFNEHALSQETLALYLSRLQRQMERHYAMLDNLLYWSAMQQQGLVSLPQRVSLAELTNEVLSLFAGSISAKQIEIVNQVEETEGWADENQTRIVIRNVIQNALKFTPPGGQIRLLSVTEGANAVLSVQDTGPGMTRQQLDQLFTAPMIQPGTTGESGSGLGLRICQDLLVSTQGTLRVASEPGRGTLFQILLPLPVKTSVSFSAYPS